MGRALTKVSVIDKMGVFVEVGLLCLNYNDKHPVPMLDRTQDIFYFYQWK